MNKQIKEAINRISECNMLMAIDCLGDLIDDIIFQNEKSAILIDNNKKTMHLLFSCSINNQKRLELILILTELLAVLDYLEMRQLIYVQYEANTDGKNTIKINTYSWSDLANKNKGFTIYEPNSYVLK